MALAVQQAPYEDEGLYLGAGRGFKNYANERTSESNIQKAYDAVWKSLAA
jgi:hypothetical protein